MRNSNLEIRIARAPLIDRTKEFDELHNNSTLLIVMLANLRHIPSGILLFANSAQIDVPTLG